MKKTNRYIIDGHAHACGEFLTPESIGRTLDAAGVDRVVLVPGEADSDKTYWLPDIAEWFSSRNVVKLTNALTGFILKLTGAAKQIPEGNEFVYDLVRRSRGRVVQFVWITKEIENPREDLTGRLADWDFRGVKLHQCWEKFSIDSEYFRSVAEWTEEHDLPLFIHLRSDSDVRDLIEYKRIHPKLKLIVAHLFGLEMFFASGLKDENLYFDSSTLQLVSTKRLMDAINFVGAGHVTLGTDTPYGKDNLRRNIHRIENLDITSEEKDLILGANILRLLKL